MLCNQCWVKRHFREAWYLRLFHTFMSGCFWLLKCVYTWKCAFVCAHDLSTLFLGLITIKEAHDIEARLNEVEKLLKTIINMPWKVSKPSSTFSPAWLLLHGDMHFHEGRKWWALPNSGKNQQVIEYLEEVASARTVWEGLQAIACNKSSCCTEKE